MSPHLVFFKLAIGFMCFVAIAAAAVLVAAFWYSAQDWFDERAFEKQLREAARRTEEKHDEEGPNG